MQPGEQPTAAGALSLACGCPAQQLPSSPARLSPLQDTNPTLVVSSQNPVNAAIMCTGSPITWKHMQVLVTTEAGTGISGTIQKDVTTAACV